MYTQPADIFSNALRREKFDEVDFDEIIIKKNETYEMEYETAPILYKPSYKDFTEPIEEGSFKMGTAPKAVMTSSAEVKTEHEVISFAGFREEPEYMLQEVSDEKTPVTEVPAGLYVDGHRQIDSAEADDEETDELSSFKEIMSTEVETAITSESAVAGNMATPPMDYRCHSVPEEVGSEAEMICDITEEETEPFAMHEAVEEDVEPAAIIIQETAEEETEPAVEITSEIAADETEPEMVAVEEEPTVEAISFIIGEETDPAVETEPEMIAVEEEPAVEVVIEVVAEETEPAVEMMPETVAEEVTETVAGVPAQIEVFDEVADIMKITVPGLHMSDDLMQELAQDWQRTIPEDGLEAHDNIFRPMRTPVKEENISCTSSAPEARRSTGKPDPYFNFRVD
jgi:hypothetical protein